MATVSSPPARQRLVLHDVDWRMYSRLLWTFAERPAIRLAYDRGVLEIMGPPPEHETDTYLLGRFVDTLTEELGLPVAGGGSTTLRRQRKQRGLEPDKCYWIANESRIRGKRRLSLRVDPGADGPERRRAPVPRRDPTALGCGRRGRPQAVGEIAITAGWARPRVP